MSAEEILIKLFLVWFVSVLLYVPFLWIYRRHDLSGIVPLLIGGVAGALYGVVITGPDFDPIASALAVITLAILVCASTTLAACRYLDTSLGKIR